MNEFNVREAYPGFCSLCHIAIAEFDGFVEVKPGVKRLRVTRMKPNFRIVNVQLSDKSIMTVALCEDCEKFKPEDASELMESEVRGWKREWDELMNDVEDGFLKNAYLDRMSKIEILDRLDKPWTDEEKKSLKKPDRTKMNLPEHISKEGKEIGVNHP